MLRALIYTLIGLLAFSFIRNVLSMISRGMAEAMRGEAQPNQPTPPKGDFGGDLVKDPVCGTFVSTKSPFSKTSDGKTHHFCSQECLNRFA